jgi:hypothetical protein
MLDKLISYTNVSVPSHPSIIAHHPTPNEYQVQPVSMLARFAFQPNYHYHHLNISLNQRNNPMLPPRHPPPAKRPPPSNRPRRHSRRALIHLDIVPALKHRVSALQAAGAGGGLHARRGRFDHAPAQGEGHGLGGDVADAVGVVAVAIAVGGRGVCV